MDPRANDHRIEDLVASPFPTGNRMDPEAVGFTVGLYDVRVVAEFDTSAATCVGETSCEFVDVPRGVGGREEAAVEFATNSRLNLHDFSWSDRLAVEPALAEQNVYASVEFSVGDIVPVSP